jgi:hypothetical protein
MHEASLEAAVDRLKKIPRAKSQLHQLNESQQQHIRAHSNPNANHDANPNAFNALAAYK